MPYLCGVGKPSSAKALKAYGSVIARGSTVIHDGDNSHKALVEALGLKEEIHTTAETKGIADDKNPMEPINEVHRYLAGFIGAFKKLWSSRYRGMTRMLDSTDDNIFTYYDFPKEIRKSVNTSNAIESFNSKLKRETRKRILANSEDNATIVVAALSRSYGKSCGNRVIQGLKDVPKDRREEMGFDF